MVRRSHYHLLELNHVKYLMQKVTLNSLKFDWLRVGLILKFRLLEKINKKP